MAKEYICRTCGSIGKPKRVNKGYFWAEIFLWLCFLIPGFLYTLWRTFNKFNMCRSCKGLEVIPTDTPMGRKLVDEMKVSKVNAV